MLLLRNGLVQEMDLFELSPKRIEEGQKKAAELGFAERIHFHSTDAFESLPNASVDLVYWNNSLHHMFDVDAAVTWSHDVLQTGGLFYMDDFVGPNRRQWSEKALTIGSRIRSLLPERYLKAPQALNAPPNKSVLPRTLVREDPERIATADPSEAVDSERILAAIKREFPEAIIRPTGGVVYHMTLVGMLQNFDSTDDRDIALLESLLLLDELCIEVPGLETHYCVAAAWKT